jgi:two-component system nitrogen regulation sensor histidine kinase NtrY
MNAGRLLPALRGLSLKWKVTVTLTAAFVAIVTVFLLVLLPFQREQRDRLLRRDQRLLATLREKHERDLIYDVLSENEDSLVVDLADLARQPDILWVRIDAGGRSLSTTADRRLIQELLDAEAVAGEALPADAVLVVRGDGRADLVGPGGRPIVGDRRVVTELPPSPSGSGPAFQEVRWRRESVLRHAADLRAADDVFGRLEILYSLAGLRRGEAQTRTIFYGLVAGTFGLVLLLLNLLISRIVIAPVRRVHEAMGHAATGDLDARLAVESRDEIGSIAESFNRMVADLAASKRKIEDYSRNLEEMVREATGELRASEQRLRELKNHLETVIAHVATGVVSLDAGGRVTTLNDRAAEILAVPREGALGKPLEEVLVGPERSRLADFVSAARRGAAGYQKTQVSLKLPQGRRTISVVASSLPTPVAGGGGTVVVFDDLTQILTAQRLEAWKEAVERVIHEIKNPLTPVGLTAQTLRSAYAEDRNRFDQLFPPAIEIILRAVTSLKDLISEFTRFARLPRAQLRRQDVNALVAETLSIYEQSLPEGVRLRLELAGGVPEVEADAEQLKRVLVNVVNNGLEAMEERGGELTVSTSSDGDGAVTIAVRDQGPGIEDVDKVFEPYYTTKAKGTGLGLLISRQIVEDHGGQVRVQSRLGEGTTVEIVLPALHGR